MAFDLSGGAASFGKRSRGLKEPWGSAGSAGGGAQGERGAPWSGAGSVNIPGSQGGQPVDFSALLAFDPGLSQFGFDTAAGGIADASQRQEFVRRALTQYGETPAGFSDPYGDLDAATIASAKANPFSSVARIAKQSDQSKKDMEASL